MGMSLLMVSEDCCGSEELGRSLYSFPRWAEGQASI